MAPDARSYGAPGAENEGRPRARDVRPAPAESTTDDSATASNPNADRVQRIIALQRLAGNRAVTSVLNRQASHASSVRASYDAQGRGAPLPASAVAHVQRVLATNIPTGSPGATLTAALAANPVAMSQFQHGETLSDAWGAPSYTGNFTNANGSDHVDGDQPLTWGAVKIGVLKPLVSFTAEGRRDSHVKMHLVNSYLHPQANNWAANWVFGPHDLNAKHTQLENAATAYHPNQNPANAALSYRAEVLTYENKAYTEDQLAQEIYDKIDAQTPPGFEPRPLATIKNRAKIAGQTLATYANNWTTALGNNIVARKIQVEYRPFQLNGAGKVVEGVAKAAPAQTAETSHVQVVLTATWSDPVKLAGKGIIFLPPAGSKHSAGGPPKGGGPAPKKHKVGT